jgi:sugar O-acyltransferase (sialic acid O-acetyltransferase NeuD family)
MGTGREFTRVIVVGGGGHAKSTIAILEKCPEYIASGYFDIEDRGAILSAPYRGDGKGLVGFSGYAFALGIVYTLSPKDRGLRRRLIDSYLEYGVDFPTIVSPDATVDRRDTIGRGTIIYDGARLNCATTIGDFCVINTGSIIEHDAYLGDHVIVASGAILCGGVTVDDGAFIGAGAVVLDGISVGNSAVVGAGSVVIKDVAPGTTVVGNPARPLLG